MVLCVSFILCSWMYIIDCVLHCVVYWEWSSQAEHCAVRLCRCRHCQPQPGTSPSVAWPLGAGWVQAAPPLSQSHCRWSPHHTPHTNHNNNHQHQHTVKLATNCMTSFCKHVEWCYHNHLDLDMIPPNIHKRMKDKPVYYGLGFTNMTQTLLTHFFNQN